jgi:hypothetical protein
VAKHERPAQVSWMLQVQYKRGEPWHDHTGDLFRIDDATAFMSERRAASPKNRYRLVRVTTTYAVEPEGKRS